MKKVNDFLGLAIEGKEVLKAARAKAVLRRWDEVVGPMLASKVSIEKYDHGTVFVEAEGSAWAQEVRLNAETIITRLHEIAEEKNLFTRIHVSIKKN